MRRSCLGCWSFAPVELVEVDLAGEHERRQCFGEFGLVGIVRSCVGFVARLVSSGPRFPCEALRVLDGGLGSLPLDAFASCLLALAPLQSRLHLEPLLFHRYELVGDARSSFLGARNPFRRIACSLGVGS